MRTDPKIKTRLAVLKAFYQLHHSFMGSREFACMPGCHTCCTRDLTATTLEGWFLIDYCHRTGRRDLVKRLCADSKPGFRPQLTINGFAAACFKSEQIPEEVHGSVLNPCPLLDEDRCAVYPARPLGCRAMVSTTTCGLNGEAQMPPLALTVNTLFQQVVEQLDIPGFFGNLVDIIRLLNDPEQGRAYSQSRPCAGEAFSLLPNEPARGLMVPPEHRVRIKSLMDEMQNIISTISENHVAPEG